MLIRISMLHSAAPMEGVTARVQTLRVMVLEAAQPITAIVMEMEPPKQLRGMPGR
jgi:hypothetical protein